MRRCYFDVKNAFGKMVKAVGNRSTGDRESIWGDVRRSVHEPRKSDFTVGQSMQSMGFPKVDADSHHGGSLYLMPYPKGDRNYTKDFVIVVRLKHARDCIERSMNWTSVRSDNEKTEYIPPPRYLERREAQCQEGLPSDWDSGVIP
ncbi:hypothetical protein B0A50_06424 [Salinomyces thailandicus]|uniref:Uncharacterized protein n=1 Tax=Salinomyces thailandicus TaxID=706561 RepID=A0A4V5N3S1_9PEZI|nr:hypothetical protein B0A50_06424 [Salinomyces thailandica]